MESRFVYRNSDGVKRTAITDSEDPTKLTVFTEVQMDEVIKSIEHARDNHKERSTNKLLAKVPLTIVETSIHEQWDEADWRKWLNDPANAVFRVWKGRV